ncbi:hypothetical protein C0583_04615 [Candidatus Parcubacteria bacterium]|nr:MAG: hypothetical protein C0583_04615 [Candidatus Parcubacteria bacterium]
MNIYLDIDQVLIKKDSKPADYVSEFLKYITDKHNVYWLTTHCRGNAQVTAQYLQDKLPDEVLPCLDKIKSTNWQTLKTEAIDFSQDFRWLDDYVMQAESNVLAENNAKEKIILINLKSEPDKLKQIMNII